MTNVTKKVLSIEAIKTLVQEKGYFKFKRQCKEEEDNSIQEEFGLTSDETIDIFKDSRLKGIRRATKRVIVFAEDISNGEIEEETPSMTIGVTTEVPNDIYEEPEVEEFVSTYNEEVINEELEENESFIDTFSEETEEIIVNTDESVFEDTSLESTEFTVEF